MEVFAGRRLCGHRRDVGPLEPRMPGDRPPTKRTDAQFARQAEALSAPATRITRTIANYD